MSQAAIADIKTSPASGVSQNVSASMRGSAIRRAPIIKGTR